MWGICRQLIITTGTCTRFSNQLIKNKCRNQIFETRKNMHSQSVFIKGKKLSIEILPALEDNYMYLIVDEGTKEAAIVDPVNPQVVLDAVERHRVDLKQVITTHHHWDHAGGNNEMKSKIKNIKIFGGDDRVEGLTDKVAHGDVLKVGNLQVKCLATPCHTSGHICYYLDGEEDSPAVFTGDTLFLSGCGRFFEGTPKQMFKALLEILGNLPNDTRVFCGHEYTIKNLQFGLKVEPDNEDIKRKLEWAGEQRKNKNPTVPGTIGDEKKANPFMRVTEPTVMSFASSSDPIDVMAALRKAKDAF